MKNPDKELEKTILEKLSIKSNKNTENKKSSFN